MRYNKYVSLYEKQIKDKIGHSMRDLYQQWKIDQMAGAAANGNGNGNSSGAGKLKRAVTAAF